MKSLAFDLKLAIRGLMRRPWISGAAAFSLALGFATLIVVLSCTSAALWNRLPVPNAERMVTIYGHSKTIGSLTNITWPQLERLAALDHFESVAGFTRFRLAWETSNNAEKINVEMVTDNYFDTVRPPLALGRPPLESGEVLLGFDFWRSRFGSSSAVVGTTIQLSGERYIVTGVAAENFRGTLLDYMGNPKAWITLRSENRLTFLRGMDLRQNWMMNWFVGAARLRPGASIEAAQQATAALERESPTPVGTTMRNARLYSAAKSNFHPEAREKVERTLTFATALAGLLLLLGCLNAALFFSGKAIGEMRQAAVEYALGAGVLRIGRRRFAEAAVLCAGALAAGAALAAAGIRILESYPPPLAAIVLKPVWDWRVWGIAAAWTSLAVVVAGLAPALIAIRARTVSVTAKASGSSRPARRLTSALVAVQVAFATLILAATGFILRTVVAAHSSDLGFDTAGLVMGEVELYSQQPDAHQRAQILRSIRSRLQDRPEVGDVATSALMPLTNMRIPARVRTEGGATLPVFRNGVSASYFETLRLPLLRGSVFGAGPGAIGQAVVNETLARTLRSDGDVVGRRLDVLDVDGRPSSQPFTITGVVRDARYHTLWQQEIPYFYTSDEADPGGVPAIVVRARGSSDAAWTAIREAIKGAVPGAIVTGPQTAESQLAELIREQSYLAVFFGALGAIAVLIASGGLLAALQLMVGQRIREIGVRQALGATRALILRRVLGHGLAVALAGLIAGVAGGLYLERYLRPLAPGTPERDIVPFALTALVMLIVAVASAFAPALRAARIEPWAAIRHPE